MRAGCAARSLGRIRLKSLGIHLVGGWATPLKNMKVNWDD